MTSPRPLGGLRVLDLSRAVAGPFAGRILADLGADVVKAELPGTDVAQAYGKVVRGRSGLYSHVNAGKRSILLDLHQPAGVARLLDLAAACDVLVENFRPGVLDRFGAGWPVLAAANEGDAVRHGGDVLAAPSVAGRGTIVEVTDGDGERRSVVRMPYRFSGASSGPPRGVPEPGEHTEAVLREWTSGTGLPYCWSAPKLPEEGRVAPPGQTARKPTLETVAARAGVSRSLVSLVLRNSPKVSATSRAAVMQAVAELGYRPNAAARLLAERRSHTVGVLLNDLRQPWFADMLDGLTPALHAGGKHILLGDGRIDRMLDETLTWSFLDYGVDGLVLAGSIPMSQAVVDVASQIPTVAVGGRGLDVGLPRADVLANDNHLGAALVVRHLAGLAHARIAHIHGLPSVAGRVRMQGYEDTMRAAGLGDHIQIEAGDMSEEGGYRATVRLMSQPGRPTAIFAANDLTCVGALSAAAALGIRVPEELSLVGFDNSVFARLRALWLTSVDATAFEMGQQAARRLLARIDHPDAPGETILLPPRLEVRGSSGPAPAR